MVDANDIPGGLGMCGTYSLRASISGPVRVTSLARAQTRGPTTATTWCPYLRTSFAARLALSLLDRASGSFNLCRSNRPNGAERHEQRDVDIEAPRYDQALLPWYALQGALDLQSVYGQMLRASLHSQKTGRHRRVWNVQGMN